MDLRLFYLSAIRTDSVPIFVNNWTGIFPLPDEETYRLYLSREEKDEESLRFLLSWKFGILPGTKKEQMLQMVLRDQKMLDQWRKSGAGAPVLFAILPRIPAEWKIFIAHILHPGKLPLYSRYALAAYAHLTGSDPKALAKKRRENFYLKTFVPFIRSEFYDIPMYKTDQALYAFGKYITEASITIP